MSDPKDQSSQAESNSPKPEGGSGSGHPPAKVEGNQTLEPVTQVARARVHSPLPAEHPFYVKIGQVTALWAQLEHTYDVMIWDLCRHSSQAEISCITGRLMGYRPRAEAVMALCELRGIDDRLITEIRSFTDRLGGLNNDRNRFVHDAWYLSTQGEISQFKAPIYKKEQFGLKDISENEVDSTINQITARIDALLKLRSRLFEALNPSQ